MRKLSVLRGGSWNNNDNNCRVANRNRNNRNNSNNNNGFRFANTAYVGIGIFLKNLERTYSGVQQNFLFSIYRGKVFIFG